VARSTFVLLNVAWAELCIKPRTAEMRSAQAICTEAATRTVGPPQVVSGAKFGLIGSPVYDTKLVTFEAVSEDASMQGLNCNLNILRRCQVSQGRSFAASTWYPHGILLL